MLRTTSLFVIRKQLCIEKNLQRSFSTWRKFSPLVSNLERKTLNTTKSSKILVSPFLTQVNEGYRVMSSQREGQDITVALSKPLPNWTKDEVQQWFKSSKYSDYSSKFLGLDGQDLAGLAKDDFLRRCPEMGDAIYVAIQELKAEKNVLNKLKLTGIKPEKIEHYTTVFNEWVKRPEEIEIMNDIQKQYQSRDKRDWNGIVVEGMSGSGKTTTTVNVCQEWIKQQKNSSIHLFTKVIFSSFYSENVDEHTGGYGLLAKYFLTQHYPSSPRPASYDKDLFVNLMQNWCKTEPSNELRIWLLQIDEYQKDPAACRAILRAVYKWNLNMEKEQPLGITPIHIIPLFSGVYLEKDLLVKNPFEVTDFRNNYYVLSILKEEQQLKLIETFKSTSKIGNSPLVNYFCEILGGWPVAYSTALTYIQMYNDNSSFSALEQLFNKILNDLENKYSKTLNNAFMSSGVTKEDVKKILLLAAVGDLTSLDEPIGKTILEKIAQHRAISLIPIGNKYQVAMPWLLFYLFNKIYNLCELQANPFDHNWRAVEEVAFASIQLHIIWAQLLKKKTIKFKDIRPGAFYSSEVAELEIPVPSVQLQAHKLHQHIWNKHAPLIDLKNIILEGGKTHDGSMGIHLNAAEGQPNFDSLHYIPNIGIVTSVKSKQFIDRKTGKQTKDLPEPKDSAFGGYVTDLVTEKPVAKNFEEFKKKFPHHYQKLSVVCKENWNIAMGPIFGQLQLKYREAYLQQLRDLGLIQKRPNSKL